MRYKHILARSISAILLLLLAACGSNVTCVEPDDFGAGFISIASLPGSGNIHSPQIPGQSFVPEYADWTDQGLTTNGGDILIVVQNNYDSNSTSSGTDSNLGRCSFAYSPNYNWTAWFGYFQANQNPPGFFPGLPICTATSSWCPGYTPSGGTTGNAPCVFTQGVGAYALLSPLDDTGTEINPPNNSSFAGTTPANAVVFHLGIGSGCNGGSNSNIYDADCPAGGLYLPSQNVATYCKYGCKLYTKMMDQLYEDNFGQYSVAIKSGFYDKPSILVDLIILIQSSLCTATKSIYIALIPYLGYIRALLVLYVAFSAIGFLIGTIEITQKELLIRVLKMAIVIQLATTGSSWNFFNTYFFNFFSNGIGEIINMFVVQNGNQNIPTGSPCVSNLGGFVILDNVVRSFLSLATFKKVMALIITSVAGFFFFFAFYFVAIVAVYSAVRAVITYLICYTVISMLIILAPIFIPFILFKATKSIFDNWLKNLISYFLQPIIVLAFAFFLAQLVQNQMYFILGIRVCWQFWLSFFLPIYRWWPAPISATQGINMVVPGRMCNPATCDSVHNECTLNNCSSYCAEYDCIGTRYVDAPYLDLNTPSDMTKFADLQSGVYIDFIDVAIFALIGWMMLKFVDIIPIIAKTLAGTPYTEAFQGGMGHGVISNIYKVGNSILSTAATGAATIYNAGKAFKANRKDGAGKLSALSAAMSAGYDTKKFDVGKEAGKAATKMKYAWQDNAMGVRMLTTIPLKIIGKAAAATATLASGIGFGAKAMLDKYRGINSNNLADFMNVAKKSFALADKTTGNLDRAIRDGALDAISAHGAKIFEGLHPNKLLAKGYKKAIRGVAGLGAKVVGGALGALVGKPGAGAAFASKGISYLADGGAKADLQSALRTAAGSNWIHKSAGAAVDKLKSRSPKLQAFLDSRGGQIASTIVKAPLKALTSSPFLSGALNSMANSLDSDEDKKERAGRQYDAFTSYQDMIGGAIDNAIEGKFARASNYVNGLTDGAFGTDINKKEGELGHEMSRLDMLRAQHALNEERWASQVEDPTDKTKTIKKKGTNWLMRKVDRDISALED